MTREEMAKVVANLSPAGAAASTSAADGHIEVFHGGERLPCRVFFDKDPRGTDADIVANRRRGATCSGVL